MLSSLYSSQTYSLPEIDSLTTRYKNEGDTEDAVKLNVEALKHFKNKDNTEGTVTAYINIANLLCTLSRYKESIDYLDKAKNEINTVKNPALYSRLYNEYGRNYASLGLYDQSNKSFNQAVQYARKISDLKQKNYQMYFSYAWKWYNFDKLNKIDSTYSMQRKCLKISSEPLIYVKIANKFIRDKKHLDSAAYYLNKANSGVDKYPVEQKAAVLLNFGHLYMTQGDNEKALENYLQALAVYQKIKNAVEIRNTYSYIADSYKSLNNPEKAAEYSEKHSALSDSIRRDGSDALNIAVERLALEKEQAQDSEKKRLYILIFAVVILSFGAMYFIRKAYVEKQKDKDALIEEKSTEADKLKKQVNSSFEEVSQLARTNDPFFLTRFKEVYAEFCEHLLSQHPNLSDHDMKFCAYLKFDLSSKEISQYENISVRAVETKKYRLKKKLELSPEIDLKKWIQEF
ncbi:tetratricopeptide repeat protein [Chryseobacterium sp. H1D6B]|uniref:tetratricopeptide repeat protein n=1 Tax=Chryseobacterium sp. H1D6B TaxID=2940588 RepID=UPI0015C803B5|nr:tetratricopeptide repeat protein [Chryseobacterium sp. H1D6B]